MDVYELIAALIFTLITVELRVAKFENVEIKLGTHNVILPLDGPIHVKRIKPEQLENFKFSIPDLLGLVAKVRGYPTVSPPSPPQLTMPSDYRELTQRYEAPQNESRSEQLQKGEVVGDKIQLNTPFQTVNSEDSVTSPTSITSGQKSRNSSLASFSTTETSVSTLIRHNKTGSEAAKKKTRKRPCNKTSRRVRVRKPKTHKDGRRRRRRRRRTTRTPSSSPPPSPTNCSSLAPQPSSSTSIPSSPTDREAYAFE